MTGTQKFVWGLVITFSGLGFFLLGALLTSTFIGAIIGIPMILVSIPLFIWGAVWSFQGQTQKQQESITAGVERGIRESRKGSVSLAASACLFGRPRPALYQRWQHTVSPLPTARAPLRTSWKPTCGLTLPPHSSPVRIATSPCGLEMALRRK